MVMRKPVLLDDYRVSIADDTMNSVCAHVRACVCMCVCIFMGSVGSRNAVRRDRDRS